MSVWKPVADTIHAIANPVCPPAKPQRTMTVWAVIESCECIVENVTKEQLAKMRLNERIAIKFIDN